MLTAIVDQILAQEPYVEWNLVCASPSAMLTLISQKHPSCAAAVTVSPATDQAYVQLMSLTPEHIPSAEIGCWSVVGVPYYKLGLATNTLPARLLRTFANSGGVKRN